MPGRSDGIGRRMEMHPRWLLSSVVDLRQAVSGSLKGRIVKLRVVFVVVAMLSATLGRVLPVEAQAASWASEVAASSPVNWWKLDNAAPGGTAVDSVSSVDGVHHSSAAATAGPAGVSSDAAVFGAAGAPHLALNGATTGYDRIGVELWVKPDGAGGARQRLIRHRTNGFHIDWLPGTGQIVGTATLGSPGGGVWASPSVTADSVTAGDWHHVVFNVGVDAVELWVDGSLRDSFNFTSTNTNGIHYSGNELTFGDDYPGAGNRSFDGALDEIVLYDRPLSGVEVEGHYTVTGRSIVPPSQGPPNSDYADAVVASNPLGYWKLDEPAGAAIAADENGVNDATVSGTRPTFDVPGAFAGSTAAHIDSRYEYLSLPGSMLNDLDAAVTAEFWFTTDKTTGRSRFLRSRTNGFGIDWLGTNQIVEAWAYTSAGRLEVQSAPLSLDEWHHVAMVFGDNGFGLVINGELHDIDAVQAGATLNNGSQFTVGNDYPNAKTRGVDATIDELAIYDRALDTHEIAGHYMAAGRLAPIGINTGEAVAACLDNGGNVLLDEPTVLTIDGTTKAYPAGCYDYDDCMSTFPGLAGDFQGWVCENQTELITALAATAGISLVVACVASGGCALAAVNAQAGAATTETALGGATGAAILLHTGGTLLSSDPTPYDLYGIGYDEAPDLESMRSPSVFGSGGHDSIGGGGEPIGPSQVCPPGSPRAGEAIPEFDTSAWTHIIEEHAPHLTNDLADPEKSHFDPGFDDVEIGDLIRATYCWGTRRENPDDPPGGYVYELQINSSQTGLPQQVGSQLGQAEYSVRVIVNTNGLIHTAFPF